MMQVKGTLHGFGNGLSHYELFNDQKKEVIAFDGEIIAEAETPIHMFPKTRNWNKRVVRLYRTNRNTYVYESIEHWCRSNTGLPHCSILSFDDVKRMLCVLLHDFGDKNVLETDTRLLLSAIRKDRGFASQIKALWKD